MSVILTTPDVTGIAAAMRSANPSWNPTEIRDAIVNNAAPLPFKGSLAVIDDIINCSTHVASFLKIELGTGQNIAMFEVQVFSSGNNVATGKSSNQSSTFKSFGARLAVDGKANTFSHTNVTSAGIPVWWQVDLGIEFPIESVTVMNRWCGDATDRNGCLCRLSLATLSLIDSKGFVVATQSTGDTCGEQELSFNKFVLPTPAPTTSPSYAPTASMNPTSSLVDSFSWVGEGSCLDESYQYYSSFVSSYLPARTKDTYCLDWCSQNPEPNLVGVEVWNWDYYGTNCLCSFSEGIPHDLNFSDYSPAADWANGYWNGIGAIMTTDGYNYTMCYRYNVSAFIVMMMLKITV